MVVQRARTGGMPRIESTVDVDVPVDIAFALSQTQGELRYRWDPFVKEQRLLDGATAPAKGVRTLTVSRHRLRMVSQYVSFRPPTQVGMKMVTGPWFFEQMSGGWSFTALSETRTRATWRYTFTCTPRWIRPVAHPIGSWFLGRDIRKRLASWAAATADRSILDRLPAGAPEH